MCDRPAVVFAWALAAAGSLVATNAAAQPVLPASAYLTFESASHDDRLPAEQPAVRGYLIEWWDADDGRWLGAADVPLERVERGTAREFAIALGDVGVPVGVPVTFTLVARGAFSDSVRSGPSSPVAFEDVASNSVPGAAQWSPRPAEMSAARVPAFAGATRDGMPFEGHTVAESLDRPTALAALPDGRVLIAEAGGRVRQIVDGALIDEPMLTWTGVTIHGMAADPAYAETHWLYLAAQSSTGSDASTIVIRVREAGGRLSEPAVILDDLPGGPDAAGALRVGPNGHLYLGTADRAGASAAQDLADAAGKVLSFTTDGRPTSGTTGFGFVHAWGFADGRVFAWDSSARNLWQMERSADGVTTDVNRVEARTNYGWAGGGTQGAEPRGPVFQWAPGSQPRAAVVYEGRLFPGMRGDLLVVVSDRPGLVRVPASQLVTPSGALEAWLHEAGTLRDVVVGADGAIYVLADDVATPGESTVIATSHVVRVSPPLTPLAPSSASDPDRRR